MPIARIFQGISLQINQQLMLDEKASHYVAHVLRAKKDDTLILFNGEGGEYEACVSQIDKKGVSVLTKYFIDRDVESPLHLILAQGIARGEKMDFIIQKAVELGAKEIFPLMTERVNVRLDRTREEKRMLHWQSVVISACEQSGRNRLPALHAPLSFNDFVTNKKADKYFVLSPHVKAKLPVETLTPNASMVLLIGPEGGLSEAEMKEAKQYDYQPLNLGPRVLRTETATLAAITALQYQYGDMK